MLKTIAMTGSRMELPIDAGVEIEKLSDRITEKNWFVDGAGAIYEWLCICANPLNTSSIMLSDYTESKQEVTSTSTDYIELVPGGTIVLPRNKTFSALNRPMVMWESGDLITIVAR